MIEPLTTDEMFIGGAPGRRQTLMDKDIIIAILGNQANPAWLSRLARVPQLEEALRRLLWSSRVGVVTLEEIEAREAAATLLIQVETCRCGRIVEQVERCPSCSACPSCEEMKPCILPDPVLDSQTYDDAARVRN